MKRSGSEISSETNQDKKRIKLDTNSNEHKADTNDNDYLINCKTHSKRLSYKNKVILGPMVRVGTFPMRLLALKYGADIVYNQELIDHKVIRFIRKANHKYSSIDFIDKSNNKLVFRTFDDEKVVFQIGSADSVRCLKACNIISNDVLGIDLNMGCPKQFSILGGMGAALLTKPETVEDIIKSLKRNLRSNLSITCKIRLLKEEKTSVELCRRLEKLNIDALCIHSRYITDRPSTVARIRLIKPITDCLQIPCIYNGDIYRYCDIKSAKEITGCSSVMIARGAQWNVSVFDSRNKLESLDKVIHQYVNISKKYNNVFQNTKYVAVKMVCGKRWLCKSDVSTAFQKMKNWNHCYDAIKVLTNALDKREQKIKNNINDPKISIYTNPSVFCVI